MKWTRTRPGLYQAGPYAVQQVDAHLGEAPPAPEQRVNIGIEARWPEPDPTGTPTPEQRRVWFNLPEGGPW